MLTIELVLTIFYIVIYYFAPMTGANYCDHCVCMTVCMSVPFAYLTTSRNFLYNDVAVARSISYVGLLLILCMRTNLLS